MTVKLNTFKSQVRAFCFSTFHFSTCHLSFIRSPFITCSVSYVQFLSPVYEMSYTSYNVSCFQMCNANLLVVMYHDVLFSLSALFFIVFQFHRVAIAESTCHETNISYTLSIIIVSHFHFTFMWNAFTSFQSNHYHLSNIIYPLSTYQDVWESANPYSRCQLSRNHVPTNQMQGIDVSRCCESVVRVSKDYITNDKWKCDKWNMI